MADSVRLQQIVEDLIEVMHLQAKEMEKLVEHVEQVSGHMGSPHQFSVVASELSGLRIRIKQLNAL